MKVEVDIEKFVSFHKRRVSLVQAFVEKKTHGRLIYQICFLGFESLARVLFPNENDSTKRFKDFLQKFITFTKKDIEGLYH